MLHLENKLWNFSNIANKTRGPCFEHLSCDLVAYLVKSLDFIFLVLANLSGLEQNVQK